ncbi:uncharacterized protein LOC130042618 isoform X2 [Sorex fumeus]|uniref:uncharacterized protein LOC130042618 isoform X2 n=1 Tax=Sorex fumeus TaxID=62283 RepID=UPI0024AE1B19|nr:uncharacterized protein LOC130042618 isoform X2 [Sorex fumeus]
MAVSGSGKSSVGALLASELGWKFYDTDDYHPEGNRVKMSSGIPLDDQLMPRSETAASYGSLILFGEICIVFHSTWTIQNATRNRKSLKLIIQDLDEEV